MEVAKITFGVLFKVNLVVCCCIKLLVVGNFEY